MSSTEQTINLPDWSKQREEIVCPLCEYNLRGLVEPRCPECGHTFQWNKLLDPAQRVHPYLFEHHPRRNIWSFVKTARGLLRPVKFWTSLHPAQPSRPLRLVLFWMICTLTTVVPAVMLFVPVCTEYYRFSLSQRQSIAAYVANNPASTNPAIMSFRATASDLDRWYPLPPAPGFFQNALRHSKRAVALAAWALGYVLWPWVTLAALLLFQITMRRAHIRIGHLMRCTIYSADLTPVLIAALLVGVAMLLRELRLAYEIASRLPSVAILILWLLPTCRLIVACKRYLRIPAPAVTVLLTQIIFLLLLAKVALDWFRIDYLRQLIQIWRV